MDPLVATSLQDAAHGNATLVHKVVTSRKRGQVGFLRFLCTRLSVHQFAIQDAAGNNPVHLAASHPHPHAAAEMVACMSATGKLVPHRNLNAANRAGDTPLHMACRAGNCKVLEYLHGCDASLANKAGDLPVHILLRRGHPSLDTLLVLLKAHPRLLYRVLQKTR